MVGLIQRLLGRTSHPLNTIFISKDKLLSNYKTLSKINSKIKIAPVLKSNAYGHGLVDVGRILASQSLTLQGGVSFFCVDSLYEALILRKAKVKSEILIMGYIDPESLKQKKFNFSFAVWDLETAQVLNKYQKGASVHIFVDTGMNREGINVADLQDFLTAMKQFNNLTISGLMSHLACADDPKNPLNALQLKNFRKAKEILKSSFQPRRLPHEFWFHLGGSYALLNLSPKDCNLIRVGKALYGITNNSNLKPVFCFKSKIVQIKDLKKGEKIGYSSTFTASKNLKIAILPLGYNDGLDRRLSNRGIVLINNVECKILGLVSMNVTVIDISSLKNPFLGQEVTIFSDNPEDKNSITNSAKLCQTISYELLVHLNPSTKRVIT